MKLRMIIADNDRDVCETLIDLIPKFNLGIEIVGVAHDSDELRDQIETNSPDIVITEIELAPKNGLDVIHWAIEKNLETRFIIINATRSFDFVYESLKLEVCDYLLKPINRSELYGALKKIREEIKFGNKAYNVNSAAFRQIFITNAISDIRPGVDSIEQINNTFGTYFKTELFCTVFVKLDHSYNVQLVNEIIRVMQLRLESFIEEFLGDVCNDMLFDLKYDGVMALINFPPENEAEIRKRILKLFIRAKKVIDQYDGLYITICVSKTYSDVNDIMKASEEVLAISWSRMLHGVGKVIFWNEIESGISPSYDEKLENLLDNIRNAFELLDIVKFNKCVDDIFSMPRSTLGSPEARSWIKRIKSDFYVINSHLIRTFADVENLKKESDYLFMMSYTFERYKDTMKTFFSGLMERIVYYTHKNKPQPIRAAILYVEQNYNKKINLTDVADEVHLNPVYFSKLFKKETGQNFNEFVSDYRITQAKKYIKKGELNVSEIADILGYADRRYFSKQFKKTVGITPKEYREMYG